MAKKVIEKKQKKDDAAARRAHNAEIDEFISGHIIAFEKSLLADAKKKRLCTCCIAQRLSLHLNVWMGQVITSAVCMAKNKGK